MYRNKKISWPLYVYVIGEISHLFDVTIGSPVGKATFHKAIYHHGYDIYMTLKDKPVVFSINLDNGKIDAISGKQKQFLLYSSICKPQL